MCGILGVIGPRPAETELDAALDVMAYRGPDGRGTWADEDVWLGHRRLSIIDKAGGGQPMIDPETGCVLTFNGEIYNYLELRHELEAKGHRFTTSSDTEVLLQAYVEWGPGCLERFNGFWAFVIWDPRVKRAFFARDRFGVKPCYYALHDGALVIGSECKALTAVAPALDEVDRSAIRDLLVHRQCHHDERSFYRRISSLAPGHWGSFTVGDRAPRITPFWRDPDPQPDGVYSEAEMVERFSEILADAVRLRLRSDVPVGLTLSGGIDSTAILDAMARQRAVMGEDVKAYTAVYLDVPEDRLADERKWARIAAAKYDNVNLAEVNASVDDWLGVMRQIVWHMDGPGFSPAVFPMWMIMKQAREEGVPVLLEGQGADEQFGGYSHYAALAFIDRAMEAVRGRDRGRARVAGEAVKAGRRSRSGLAFTRDVAVEVVPPIRRWQERRSSLRTAYIGGPVGVKASHGRGGHFERRLSADFSVNTLPPFLQYGDAISMAHSIETRLPFLDYRLVELAFSFPPDARISAGEAKRVLRGYLRGAGQTEVADRHDKRGYPTPAYEWLGADNGRRLRDVLLDPGAKVLELIDRTALEGLIDKHASGRFAGGDALYSLLTTELWWETVG